VVAAATTPTDIARKNVRLKEMVRCEPRLLSQLLGTGNPALGRMKQQQGDLCR
jgi:hypothetical protein